MKTVNESAVELIDSMGNDITVVNAARVSFDKQSEYRTIGVQEEYDVDSRLISHYPIEVLKEEDEKLIKYLARHNHWSPFAHTGITLRVSAPIFVARQLVKHQVGGVWNEVSRRYVDDEITNLGNNLNNTIGDYIQLSEKGVATGVATLDGNGYVPSTQLSLTRSQVGLSNVDNTSDANKPVSTATSSALALKSNLNSPTFTGTPSAPTASTGTDTTQIATTEFVQNAIETVIGAAPSALDTLQEIATSLNNDSDLAGTLTNLIGTKVTLSEARQGLSAGNGITYNNSTGAISTDSTVVATKTYVDSGISDLESTINDELDLKAPLAGPTFTGNVTLPSTTNIGDVSPTELSYVNGVTSSIQDQLNSKLASAFLKLLTDISFINSFYFKKSEVYLVSKFTFSFI